MKFGLRYACLGRYSNGPHGRGAGTGGRGRRFDSIWTVEHVVVPTDISRGTRIPERADGSASRTTDPDPLIWLAYIGRPRGRSSYGTAILHPSPAQSRGHRQENATSITDGRRRVLLASAWAGSPRSSPLWEFP